MSHSPEDLTVPQYIALLYDQERMVSHCSHEMIVHALDNALVLRRAGVDGIRHVSYSMLFGLFLETVSGCSQFRPGRHALSMLDDGSFATEAIAKTMVESNTFSVLRSLLDLIMRLICPGPGLIRETFFIQQDMQEVLDAHRLVGRDEDE
jgi:hypothetical protein